MKNTISQNYEWKNFPLLSKSFDSVEEAIGNLYHMLQNIDLLKRRLKTYSPDDIWNILVELRDTLLEAKKIHLEKLNTYVNEKKQAMTSSSLVNVEKDEVLQKAQDILGVSHIGDTMDMLYLDIRNRPSIMVAGVLESLDRWEKERMQHFISLFDIVVKKIIDFMLVQRSRLVKAGVHSPVQAFLLNTSLQIEQVMSGKEGYWDYVIKSLDRIIETISWEKQQEEMK